MELTHQYCRRVGYSDEMELPEIRCTVGNRQGDVHEEMLDTIIRVGQLKVEINHEKNIQFQAQSRLENTDDTGKMAG